VEEIIAKVGRLVICEVSNAGLFVPRPLPHTVPTISQTPVTLLHKTPNCHKNTQTRFPIPNRVIKPSSNGLCNITCQHLINANAAAMPPRYYQAPFSLLAKMLRRSQLLLPSLIGCRFCERSFAIDPRSHDADTYCHELAYHSIRDITNAKVSDKKL